MIVMSMRASMRVVVLVSVGLAASSCRCGREDAPRGAAGGGGDGGPAGAVAPPAPRVVPMRVARALVAAGGEFALLELVDGAAPQGAAGRPVLLVRAEGGPASLSGEFALLARGAGAATARLRRYEADGALATRPLPAAAPAAGIEGGTAPVPALAAAAVPGSYTVAAGRYRAEVRAPGGALLEEGRAGAGWLAALRRPAAGTSVAAGSAPAAGPAPAAGRAPELVLGLARADCPALAGTWRSANLGGGGGSWRFKDGRFEAEITTGAKPTRVSGTAAVGPGCEVMLAGAQEGGGELRWQAFVRPDLGLGIGMRLPGGGGPVVWVKDEPTPLGRLAGSWLLYGLDPVREGRITITASGELTGEVALQGGAAPIRGRLAAGAGGAITGTWEVTTTSPAGSPGAAASGAAVPAPAPPSAAAAPQPAGPAPRPASPAKGPAHP